MGVPGFFAWLLKNKKKIGTQKLIVNNLKTKIKYLPKRKGERFSSALTRMNLNNKIIRLSAKISLKNYVNNFLMNNR